MSPRGTRFSCSPARLALSPRATKQRAAICVRNTDSVERTVTGSGSGRPGGVTYRSVSEAWGFVSSRQLGDLIALPIAAMPGRRIEGHISGLAARGVARAGGRICSR